MNLRKEFTFIYILYVLYFVIFIIYIYGCIDENYYEVFEFSNFLFSRIFFSVFDEFEHISI